MTDEIQPEVVPEKVVEDAKPESDEILAELTDTEVESKDSEPDPDSEPEDKDDETLKEEDTETEATPEEEQEDKEEDPKEEPIDPKEEARRRYEERQAFIAERKQKIKETTSEYVNEADDDTEKRLRAVEVQEYERLIEHNENTLVGEFERVKANNDLQMFNPDSEEFNEMAYNKAIKDFNAGYLGYDANGYLTEVKGSLYQHLTETAELLNSAIKSGQIKQVKDARKMKLSADSKPAETPKEIKKDTILEELMSD
jgi:hypothetical protein